MTLNFLKDKKIIYVYIIYNNGEMEIITITNFTIIITYTHLYMSIFFFTSY